MAVLSLDHPWAFAFGILGNIISFMVYLAPLPTFYRVYRKKSTEGFQSVPYVVALFSSMLWIYYAFLNTSVSLLITINSFGCVIETIYIVMYIIYAPKKAKIFTVKILFLLNVVIFGLILLLTLFLSEGPRRVRILGWVCVAFSVSVFIAPLSVIRLVIRTKSVEFMPFFLSFFLTLSAVAWFFYGLLSKDKYVALPNILGFTFGVAQMVLYLIYRNKKPAVIEECKDPELGLAIGKISATEKGAEVHPIDSKSPSSSDEESSEQGEQSNNDRAIISGNGGVESTGNVEV
ncbi:Bidirectional sugar transporter SWEET [Rhynchospora pubera]|uniref:Bidirectional sugar transporter SWEET n=1 Tax=Rhynchospora pubera TaxID=906938 RepID=A0AAV8DG55_9POAL|nr:Bidirectional sugar transporter SWEET [Rhynchospora pubera]